MSACPQCGTLAARPTDNFCNVCGTALARRQSAPAAPPAPPPAYTPPPPQAAPPQYVPQQGAYFPTPLPPGFGLPPGPAGRCAMGHEVAPGTSYCVQGHPIALDPTQMSMDPFGVGRPAFGTPPPQRPYRSQQPPPQGGPYGVPPAQAPMVSPGPVAQYPAAVPAPVAPREVPPKALRGFLVAYGANPSGEFWPLTGGRHSVGRLGAVEGTDISLADPTISSRHAALHVDAPSGSVTVEDTGSTNGTFVNDEHIGVNGRRELRDGDRLRFGGFTTTVKIIGRV